MQTNNRSLILVLASLVVVLLVAVIALLIRSRPDAPPVASAPQVREVHDAMLVGGQLDGLRRGVPIDQEASPLPMARVENVDITRIRAYPMQPPTIPHAIDGYQISKDANRCMLCHARANAASFQAPPVSVTHYMDRDDQFLAAISARRYFCNQCHVVQTDAKPLVTNTFKDVDAMLSSEKVN